MKYAYDHHDRLMYLSENGPSTTLASIFYDAQGRRAELDRDALGARTLYGYDVLSRLDSLAHDLDGAGAGYDVTMGLAYNPASQIVTRALTNGAYEYAVASANRSYAVNGLNQYTQIGGDAPASLAWDANGNLTADGASSFGYDTENRLVSASGAKNATLKYDPLGRLYEVSAASGVTRFLYDWDRLIGEYNGSGTILRRHVHGAGVDGPLVTYEGPAVSAASRRYLHADHQGSIVALTNSAGATLQVHAYDPYGVTGANNTGRFQYTGQAAIPEVGLYYYKARFYHPTLGRFVQTDPIGYEDELSLYAYVRNDPLNQTDPTGNCSSCLGAIVGGGLELLVQAVEIEAGIRTEYSLGDVGIAAVAGATGVGAARVIGRAASIGKIGKAIANRTADASVSAASQAAKDGEVSLAETVTDVAAGALVGGPVGDRAAAAAARSAEGKVLRRQADRAERIAGNSSRQSRQDAAASARAAEQDHAAAAAAVAGANAANAGSSAVKIGCAVAGKPNC